MDGPCILCGGQANYRLKGYGSVDKRCQRCRSLARFVSRLKKMGLTLEQHEADVREAQGCCNACGQEGPLNRDHCHASGKARGLLCLSCNLILGHAHDDVDRLIALIEYLEDYEDIHSIDND